MRRLQRLFLCAAVVSAGCQASTDSASSSSDARKPSSSTRPAAARVQATPAPPVQLVEGTVLPLRLETGLSSATSRAGELIVARLSEDVRVGEKVVLKEGTEVRGHVTEAVPSGRVKGRAQLGF